VELYHQAVKYIDVRETKLCAASEAVAAKFGDTAVMLRGTTPDIQTAILWETSLDPFQFYISTTSAR